jgi:hypothetical protein
VGNPLFDPFEQWIQEYLLPEGRKSGITPESNNNKNSCIVIEYAPQIWKS